MERLTARDQRLCIRTACEQVAEGQNGFEEVLEVVEQEQELPVSHVLPELLARPELLGRRLEHQARLAQRRERHPPDPVLVLGDEHGRGLDGEPRLARAADPCEREQPHRLAAKQIDDLDDLLRTPEERRGQVRRAGVCRPMRTRIGPEESARRPWAAAWSAPGAVGKT
jgi:hypothetical protein